ncbi:MAG: ABC transporter ATP-binding protein [Melioribacteraceae bacterium]|nr:ABC transporter ATP-binding protein [Melioribacteraceae bacterium]
MLLVKNINVNLGEFNLTNINFNVESGDYFVVLGASGVGKSVLLESIVGIKKIESGNVILNNEDITHKEINERKLSIVLQSVDLFPHYTVYENIAYPLRIKKSKNVNQKVLHYAEKVGIENKLEKKPETLSGGEAQRVALARCLATEYNLILLDEPLASLDVKSKYELKMLLRKLNREGITFIHVTHDYEESISLANKIAVLEKGTIVDLNSPEVIFKNPKSEFIANFIGHKNFIKGKIQSVNNSDLKIFTSDYDIDIYCLTDIDDGEAFLTISSNDISISNQKEKSSNRNNFYGKIIDIAKARIGYEIIIDSNYKFAVAISKESIENLDLKIGKEVWLSFKASACKIYR